MRLPAICPCCDAVLGVSTLKCDHCQTTINGNYPMPVFLRLTPDEQEFVMKFLLASGSIKEMAAQEGISYPTLRNRLDDLIEKVKQLQQ